ncbi:MAG: MgtC/SapB family protein [Acidimicrobiia bacterium]
MNLFDAIARLGMAALLSGVVGFEREAAQKAAGLRTHILVGLGAALFGLLSLEGFRAPDPSRIAAQVVTGIGFLGAGAIFREGRLVRGLTTAAGLWTVAAIGLAAGAAMYAVAVAATVVTLIVLYGLRYVDRIVAARTEQSAVPFEVKLADFSRLGEVLEAAARILEEPVEQVRYLSAEEGTAIVRFQVRADEIAELSAILTTLEGVQSAEAAD